MVKKSMTISPDVITDEDESDMPARVIRIFLSYSHKDKKLSGELKKKLESNGFEAFMAHEDIEPSKKWEEEIFRNLKECDIFIPIVSKNFKKSKWTDQETGIAFAEDKIIIPIDIGLVPYGFIGKYQALKYNENISHTCEKIMDIIRKSPIYDKVKSFFIKRFVESGHFSEANERIEELKLVESFTNDQINEIIRGYVNNFEIRGGFRSRPFVDSLFKKYSEVIDPELKEQYEACPETQQTRAMKVAEETDPRGDRKTVEHIRFLRAKIDEFYGPLFENLTIFHLGDRERTNHSLLDPFMRDHLIRDKYPTMASDRLRGLLDRYFRITEQDIRMEHGKPDDKWKPVLDEIIETIQVDYEKLKNEYDELMDEIFG